MTRLSSRVERRRNNRVSAGKGAVAFHAGKYGRIIDVSLDGLCFQYFDDKSEEKGREADKQKAGGSLDIVFGAYDFFLVDLPVRVVADFQASSHHSGEHAGIVRRRTVVFEELASHQLFNLKRFLLLNQYGNEQAEVQTATGQTVNYYTGQQQALQKNAGVDVNDEKAEKL